MVTMQQLIFHTSSVVSLELQLLPKDVQQSQCHQWAVNLRLVDHHQWVGSHQKVHQVILKKFC
jgi:hypothetical protein